MKAKHIKKIHSVIISVLLIESLEKKGKVTLFVF